jgi:mono/diheme cytochrome c family protein
MLTPNITPDPETGIGRWSSGDFYRALHDGVNKRGQDMYPTMPYDFYTRVTARGRRCALRLPAHDETGAQRRSTSTTSTSRSTCAWAWAVWRELYFVEGTYRPDASKPASWNRGAYLVEGLGHCSDCHSPRNLLGGIEKSKAMSGALIDGWFALDLTSDIATGLGSWTAQDLAGYFKTGVAKDKTTTLRAPWPRSSATASRT